MKGHPVNKDPSLYERTMSGKWRLKRKLPSANIKKPVPRMRQGNPEHDPAALGFIDVWKRLASWYLQHYTGNRDGINVRALSRATGIAHRDLATYLVRQDRAPRIEKADLILRALGISLNDLIFSSEVIPAALLPKKKKEEKLQKHLRSIDTACRELTRSPDDRARIAGGRVAEALDDICDMYKLTLVDVLDPIGEEMHSGGEEKDLQSSPNRVTIASDGAGKTDQPPDFKA